MMKNKIVLGTVAILTTLSLSGAASADTTRDQIEAGGNQQIQNYWNQYQQAMQARQDAWNKYQGDRYTPEYQEADAKAGATYQEWLRARTALGDKLHNYDVEQLQKEEANSQSQAVNDTPASSESSSQAQPARSQANSASHQAVQPAQSDSTQPDTASPVTNQQPVASVTTHYAQSSISAKPSVVKSASSNSSKVAVSATGNIPQGSKQTVKTTSVSKESHESTLPQTGNSNSLLGLGLVSLMVTLGLGLKHKFN